MANNVIGGTFRKKGVANNVNGGTFRKNGMANNVIGDTFRKKAMANNVFEVFFKKDYPKDKGDNSLFHLLKQTIIAFYYY